MMIAVHLRIAGVLLIVLGLMHLGFPRRFAWKEELARLSLLNRRIFQVHTFFVVLVVEMMGVGSVFYAADLVKPGPLSRMVLGGALIFWTFRLMAQFFVYDVELWRGNRVYTAVHIVFSVLWMYLVAVYGWALRCVV
jgi:hypothetical protein